MTWGVALVHFQNFFYFKTQYVYYLKNMWFPQTESYPKTLANISFCRFSWRVSLTSPVLGPLLSFSLFTPTCLSANLRGNFYAEPLMHSLVKKPVMRVHFGSSPSCRLGWGWFPLTISSRDGIEWEKAGLSNGNLDLWLPSGSHTDSILMSALGLKRLFWNPVRRVFIMGKINNNSWEVWCTHHSTWHQEATLQVNMLTICITLDWSLNHSRLWLTQL